MAKKSYVQYVRYYTVGSAARELDIQAPERPKALPKPRKAKKILIYIDPAAVFGVVTAMVMVIVMTLGMIRFFELRAQNVAMGNYVQQLIEENRQLTEEYESGYDLQNVEKTALALGMVPAEQVERIQLGE